MTPRPVDTPGAVGTTPDEVPDRPPAARRDPVQRWRLVLRRAGGDAGAAQKAWLAALAGRLGDAGLPLAGLELDPPRPRVTLAAPLPAGVPGERELVDLLLVERLPAWRVREAVADAGEAGTLVDLHDIWLGEPPLPGQVTGAVYRVHVAAPPTGRPLGRLLSDGAVEMLAAPTLPRVRRKGDGAVDYDLRPFLVDIRAVPADDRSPRVHGIELIVVRATVRHDPEKGIGRPDEVLDELAARSGVHLQRLDLVRERLLLADELAPIGAEPVGPARQRGRQRGNAPGTRVRHSHWPTGVSDGRDVDR